MADLSHMSDDELRAIARQHALTKMSDEELKKLAGGDFPKDVSDATIAKSVNKNFLAKAADKVLGPSDSADVTQEMHPDISAFERFAAQNTATGIDAKVDYLRRQHPELDIQKRGSQVLIKTPGDAKFKVLDPGRMANGDSVLGDLARGAKEGLMDLTDVGGDVASGIGTTLATAAGGAGGFAAGGPPGAIAGGAAAGAGAGGALETLRQGAGRLLGVNQEFDPNQIKMATAAGAAASLLMGTGATANQLATKAAEKGLSGAATEAFIQGGMEAQRGLAGKAAETLGTKIGAPIGAMLSGVPEEVIRTGAKNNQAIKEIAKVGIDQPLRAVKQDTEQILKDHLAQSGKAVGDTVASAKGRVDLSEAEASLKQGLANLQAQYQDSGSPVIRDQMNAMKTTLGKLENKLPPQVSQGAKDVFNPLTGQYEPGLPGPIIPESRVDRTVSPQSAWTIMKDLQDQAKMTSGGLTGAESVAEKHQARAAGSAADNIYQQLDAATEGRFSAANEAHSQNAADMDLVKKYFNPRDASGQQTYQKLGSVLNDAKEPDFQALQRIDENHGTQLIPTADLVRAYKVYKNPEFFAKSAGGTTSTSRTSLGQEMANMIPFRTLRNAVKIGTAVGSGPKAQKLIFDTKDLLKNNPTAVGASGRSAWNMLDAGENP